MANESHCPRCSNVYESRIHVVRDCTFSKTVWWSIVPTHSQWSALNKGWSKLNTNGAVSLNGSYVAIGGVIRDANVNKLWGFSMLLSKDIIFKIKV
ncbi:hypothetical protein Gotur_008205, partial [Gossypium turneri]